MKIRNSISLFRETLLPRESSNVFAFPNPVSLPYAQGYMQKKYTCKTFNCITNTARFLTPGYCNFTSKYPHVLSYAREQRKFLNEQYIFLILPTWSHPNTTNNTLRFIQFIILINLSLLIIIINLVWLIYPRKKDESNFSL